MNIRRLIATGASAALILSTTAVPALGHHRGDDNTTIRNSASVSNYVETEANTGENSIRGGKVRGGEIKTGNADALATVVNDVNTTELGCGCLEDGDLTINNRARVRNNVKTEANTGENSIRGWRISDGLIDTGDAYADSYVENVVNTTLVE